MFRCHQDLTHSQKYFWFIAPSSGKQNTGHEHCHLLREMWASSTPSLPSSKATKLLWEAGRADRVWYCRLLLLMVKFLTYSASICSPVKLDNGHFVWLLYTLKLAQLLAQKRHSTNVCWAGACPKWLKVCLLLLHRILSLKFVSTFEKILKLQLLYCSAADRLLGRGEGAVKMKRQEYRNIWCSSLLLRRNLLDFACCVWQVPAVRAITKAPQYVVHLGTIKELQGPEPAPRRTFLVSPLKPTLDCWHWTKGCLSLELCFILRCKFVMRTHI